MPVDPKDLHVKLLKAHYDALNDYKLALTRRITHIVVLEGAPRGLATSMGKAIPEELEKLIIGHTHEDVKTKLEKML